MLAIDEVTITSDGELLQVSRLGACDRDAIAEVFARMSDESRRMRFLAAKPTLSKAELRHLTDLDHASHDAIAALAPDGRIVAVARYAELCPGSAELAIEVVDEYQGRGIGPVLLQQVIDLARARSYCRLAASILWE